MTLIEFEYELIKEGNNTDEVFFSHCLFPECHYINDVVFENGIIYLKENLDCEYKVYTCEQLYYNFDNLLLDDNTEVRFVFVNERYNNKEQECGDIFIPFFKKGNIVYIEIR
jgi:hypothetical protein